MKKVFLLSLVFLLIGTHLSSQNYYVATVSGKVYYKGKILKKRDKIKIKGELKFSSKDDYVKFSGPGGLFTVSPESTPNRNNEFLVALRQELFPQERFHATVSNNFVMNYIIPFYFGLNSSYSYTMYEEEYLKFDSDDIYAENGAFGFLHETDFGLVYMPTEVKDSLLYLSKNHFKLKTVDGKTPQIRKTAIVKVLNETLFDSLLVSLDSIAEFGIHADIHGDLNPINRTTYFYDADTEQMDSLITQPALIILDYISTPRFISKKDLVKDLKFHVKKTKAPDIETFLDDYGFDSYIFSTWGDLWHNKEYDILRNECQLKSIYDEQAIGF